MANTAHTAALKSFLDADVDMLSATIKIIGIDTADDTVNPASDDFLDDILSAARVGTATLASKTTTGGTFDSGDPTMSSVTGDQFEEVELYEDSGTASTSDLLVNYDTFTSGMPVTPNGGDIEFSVNASGWFSL